MSIKQVIKSSLSLLLILTSISYNIAYATSLDSEESQQSHKEIQETQNEEQFQEPASAEPVAPTYYTITWIYFNGETDTEQVEENSTYYTREAPYVLGYDFMYWETDTSNVQGSAEQIATGSKVYRARYEAVYHDITWIYDDGTVDTEQVQEGSSYRVRYPEHKVGYEFTGWQSRKARNTVYQGEEIAAYSDETYMATYEKLLYDLTLNVEDLNGYPLSRAKVEIKDSNGTRQAVKSKGNGEFTAAQLEDGEYRIKTTYLNEYGTVTKNNTLTINLSDNTEVEETITMRTARLSDVPNPTADSNLSVYGAVNPINIIDITMPVSMTFRIDGNRIFHKPEGIKIVSRCPAPLNISVLSINKSMNAPDLVTGTKYTDRQWNNLNKQQTRSEIHLSLNGHDLSKIGTSIGSLKSAFREPQELKLNLSSKYGKSWDNKTELTFTYNIICEFSMP